jgi:hypothetical protein
MPDEPAQQMRGARDLQSEPTSIFVRAHTRESKEKPHKDDFSQLHDKWAHFALVFDCETTTDIRQDLNFFWWRFCELKNDLYVCQQEGVVYADSLKTASVRLIRSFARSKRANVEDGCPEEIVVGSRTEFVDGKFWHAIQAGAVIVCFNSPFDLSRLALDYGEARGKNLGWSMTLWRQKGRRDKKPKLRIKPKDSRSAFISLVGDMGDRVHYRGRFLDLSVLGWALRNQHMKLDGFLESFKLKGKAKHTPQGRVTKAELRYGRQDVKRTVELLNAMKREYDGFPLTLPPEKAMSAASITKAFLDEMRITPPAKKFTIPDHILGKCMQAYYGGRSEVRIRHSEVPVVVCDTTSEYPTVAALLKLWRLLVASDIEVVNCTDEARLVLGRVTLKTLLDPTTWPDLAFFASIKPAGDHLPIRAVYGDSGNTNIGVNPLTCGEPIWYAGPDLAASGLKSGHSPSVVHAFRLVPRGMQQRMATTSIGKRTIDPQKDDFFQAVIEERKSLPKDHPHYRLLKIIANSLYGIFAELNKSDYGKNNVKSLQVFSGEEHFEQPSHKVERPGRWQFPPAAALITAGGRLVLAILEAMIERRKGAYLLTDTDSMLIVGSEKGGLVPCLGGQHRMRGGEPAVRALTWNEVERVCARLNCLNPYNREVVGEMLKIEDYNLDRSGKQHQLYGLAVSAKRYVVYKRRNGGLEIIKPSEHGLGMVFIPDKRERYRPVDCKEQESSYLLWIVEAWEQLLADHFRNLKDPENPIVGPELWFESLPAMMRIRITTPNVMKALRKRDPGAGKPYNFALSPILIQPVSGCTLVTASTKSPHDWLSRNYVEIHSGDVVKLGRDYRGMRLEPQTLATVLWRHYLHPEDKSLAPDGGRCGMYTSGLLSRRPIQAIPPFILIGKEIERRSQEGEDISIVEGTGPVRYQRRQTPKTRPADDTLILRAKRFSMRQLMRASGVSQHAVERFLRGERIHPGTRERLAKAVEALEGAANYR